MSHVHGRCLCKFIVAVNWLFFGVEVFFLVLLWGIAAGYIGVSRTIVEIFKPFLTSEGFRYLNENLENSASVLTWFGIVIAGYFLYEMFMNILLTVAVDKSDTNKLGLWVVISWIFFLIRMFYLLHTSGNGEAGKYLIVSDIVITTWLVLSFIPIYVILHFLDSLMPAESRDDISRGSKFDKDPTMNV